MTAASLVLAGGSRAGACAGRERGRVFSQAGPELRPREPTCPALHSPLLPADTSRGPQPPPPGPRGEAPAPEPVLSRGPSPPAPGGGLRGATLHAGGEGPGWGLGSPVAPLRTDAQTWKRQRGSPPAPPAGSALGNWSPVPCACLLARPGASGPLCTLPSARTPTDPRPPGGSLFACKPNSIVTSSRRIPPAQRTGSPYVPVDPTPCPPGNASRRPLSLDTRVGRDRLLPRDPALGVCRGGRLLDRVAGAQEHTRRTRGVRSRDDALEGSGICTPRGLKVGKGIKRIC
nr:uncharacterized protein LOC112934412 [Vulpes vulpes]